MKTKITRLILMIAFIISAVQCSVEGTDQSHFPYGPVRPESPDLGAPPLEEPLPFVPLPVAPEVHIYTEQEQQQIHQSLIGRYQGVFNNELMVIDIRADHLVYINNQIALPHTYTTFFPPGQPPVLFLTNIAFFHIDFNFDNLNEIFGLRHILTQAYFHRLENNENNNPHDEL